MEHAQNIRIVLSSAVLLVATAVGLAGCATPVVLGQTGSAAADSAGHRALARASAEHYVDGLIRSARDVEAAERSTQSRPNLRQLLEADRPPDTASESPSVAPPNGRHPVPSDRPPAIAPEPAPSAPDRNLRQQVESDRPPIPTSEPSLDVRFLSGSDRPLRLPRLGVAF